MVVYNPTKIAESTLRSLVERHAAPNLRIEWVATTTDDDGAAQVAASTPSNVDTVLVAGGDGTVRLIASAIAGTGIALGVIPIGTGNLLARNLNLDLDPRASVERGLFGEDRAIDICWARLHRPDGTTDRQAFTVMAGVGVDADMLVNTDEAMKRRFGPVAYVGGIARSLGGGNNVEATITLDGERYTGHMHTLIFGNCGDLINEIPLFPDAEPDDGLFDAVAMAPSGVAGWARIGAKLMDNTIRRKSMKLIDATTPHDLTYIQAERATVEFTQPQVFEVDGDMVGEVVALEIEVDPAALTIRM